MVAETAPLHRALPHRGSPQSILGNWDPTPPPQRADTPPEVTQDLRAEPVSADGIKELRHLQENLPGVVADVYRSKREGRRPSDKQRKQRCAEWRLYCRRWNSLRIGPDGLLTVSLAANHSRPTQERTLCPAAIRRELIEEVHQQAHGGAQQVLTELQLWWYWPNMEREVRRRVRQCEVCQASKNGRPPDRVGRRKQSAKGPGRRRLLTWSTTHPGHNPKLWRGKKSYLRSWKCAHRLQRSGCRHHFLDQKPIWKCKTPPREGLHTEILGKLHLSQTGWKHHP